MKKTIKKTKKVDPLERIAIALEKLSENFEYSLHFSPTGIEKTEIKKNTGEFITFPSKTAKEIMDECDNKVAGGKLLYSTSWYENEDFFTKEKCRPRTVKIPTEILHTDKSWDETKKLIGEENMFNFSEIVYLLRESKSFRKLLDCNNSVRYTWTNSRASGGGLVYVGRFDSGGSFVDRWKPGPSDSYLGVCFSRSE